VEINAFCHEFIVLLISTWNDCCFNNFNLERLQVLTKLMVSNSQTSFQQCALVDRELLQRLAFDARHDTGNEPARQAHLNDRDQRAVGLEGGGGWLFAWRLRRWTPANGE